MAKPLEGGIAKQVAKAIKAAKLDRPATLIKIAPGTRSTSAYSAGTNPSGTPHAARGYIDDFKVQAIDNTTVFAGDRIVNLLGATIAGGVTPAVDDQVTIAGATYRIRRVTSDPANAVFMCQTHGAALPP